MSTEKTTQQASVQDNSASATFTWWENANCSGKIRRQYVAPPVGCQTFFSSSEKYSCDNKTGFIRYSYPQDRYCRTEWEHAEITEVNTCARIGELTTSAYCGDVRFRPGGTPPLQCPPVPEPIPGDGTVEQRRNYPCDYLNGGCPKNTLLKVWYTDGVCENPQSEPAELLYGGVTLSKCYLFLDSYGFPTSNLEAMQQDGLLSLVRYSSGCHSGKDSVGLTSFRLNTCFSIRIPDLVRYFKYIIS